MKVFAKPSMMIKRGTITLLQVWQEGRGRKFKKLKKKDRKKAQVEDTDETKADSFMKGYGTLLKSFEKKQRNAQITEVNKKKVARFTDVTGTRKKRKKKGKTLAERQQEEKEDEEEEEEAEEEEEGKRKKKSKYKKGKGKKRKLQYDDDDEEDEEAAASTRTSKKQKPQKSTLAAKALLKYSNSKVHFHKTSSGKGKPIHLAWGFLLTPGSSMYPNPAPSVRNNKVILVIHKSLAASKTIDVRKYSPVYSQAGEARFLDSTTEVCGDAPVFLNACHSTFEREKVGLAITVPVKNIKMYQ
jgi:hypothetical protein